MNPSFDLETPDHFTTGAVGTPGQRVFYLQGREASTLVTLKVEKEQVSALADYLTGLLARLATPEEAATRDLDLVEPIEPAWVVGSIGVGYDEGRDRIVVVASELQEEEEEGEGEAATREDPASARFQLTRVQVAAFVERARALIKAGRPICPICSLPRDPGGHVCPRSNGHLVRPS